MLAVAQLHAIELSNARDGVSTKVQLFTVPSIPATVPVMSPVVLTDIPPNRAKDARETPKLD